LRIAFSAEVRPREDLPEHPIVKPARNTAPAARRTLVIVDDEKSYVELMAQMIADNLDCPVHAFTNPVEALDKLPGLSAAVIVSDYFMPKMDGVEFIKRASRTLPDAVFIMISGHDLDHIEHELVRLANLKKRLQKPFGWRPLAQAVIDSWPGEDVPAYRT
jgi:CheY-like chemotaxis protein